MPIKYIMIQAVRFLGTILFSIWSINRKIISCFGIGVMKSGTFGWWESTATVLPCDAINVKAFQNGKELNVIVYTGQEIEGAIQCDTSVQTDTVFPLLF